jgi:DNA modification methylase
MPLIFEKANPLTHFRKNGFRSCYEMGIWLVNDGGNFSQPKTFHFLDQKIMKNVMPYHIGQQGEKLTRHPTEKPLRLISHLVEIFTNQGDIVLDSFAGSGTT